MRSFALAKLSIIAVVLFDHTSHGQTSSEGELIRQLKELQVKNKKTIEKIIKDQNSTLRINPTTVQNLT